MSEKKSITDQHGEAPSELAASTCSTLPPVLDVCCGPKGMWFNKHDPRAMFADRRREYWKMEHPSGTRTANIDPDIIADFTNLPFPDESFALVVMDPPHIVREKTSGMVARQYGNLSGDWREMLRRGFAECFRVLRPDGVLIFKWNECNIPVREILQLTDTPPLFGHKSGKYMQTHWVSFLKQNNQDQQP
jgi:SAM-dependent methyltransferase